MTFLGFRPLLFFDPIQIWRAGVLRRFSKGLNVGGYNRRKLGLAVEESSTERQIGGGLQFEILLKMSGVLTSGPTFKRFNRLKGSH